MRKIKKWTKLIEKTEKEIERLQRKIDIQRKREEVGEITKAEFTKAKAKPRW